MTEGTIQYLSSKHQQNELHSFGITGSNSSSLSETSQRPNVTTHLQEPPRVTTKESRPKGLHVQQVWEELVHELSQARSEEDSLTPGNQWQEEEEDTASLEGVLSSHYGVTPTYLSVASADDEKLKPQRASSIQFGASRVGEFQDTRHVVGEQLLKNLNCASNEEFYSNTPPNFSRFGSGYGGRFGETGLWKNNDQIDNITSESTNSKTCLHYDDKSEGTSQINVNMKRKQKKRVSRLRNAVSGEANKTLEKRLLDNSDDSKLSSSENTNKIEHADTRGTVSGKKGRKLSMQQKRSATKVHKQKLVISDLNAVTVSQLGEKFHETEHGTGSSDTENSQSEKTEIEKSKKKTVGGKK